MVSIYHNWLDKSTADAFYLALKNEVIWKEDYVTLFGKRHLAPRLIAWQNDKNKPYAYSGVEHESTNFTKTVHKIKMGVEKKLQQSFNSVLINFYRNGTDSMGWHADNEKILGQNPTIASVSLGELRNFKLKHIKTGEKINIQLPNGSLLVMKGETQHFWKHSIPKTKKEIGGRINLTFRTLISL